jgi:hypothetical protein
MKYRDPLKKILEQTRSHWDHDRLRPDARRAFLKVLQCRTLALGAEVYSSKNQERIVFHTCKSRACPSCGHRATIQWQRERWAALPDVGYKGITFTMPQPLWMLFRANRVLAGALPALAASVIQGWMMAKHGLRVGVMAILHTFNGRLEYNSHVHTMVSAGGLHAPSGLWVPSIYFDNDRLMKLWRRAVIRLLREAHKADLLRTEVSFREMEAMLTHHEGHWWSVKIQSFESRERFLRYAGRYVKRPPIAQRRITHIGKTKVTFWTKDKKLRRRVEVQCSPEEFVDRWSQHVADRYKHSVRGFGLFAPRMVNQALAEIFRIVGQQQRRRPKRRSWADSIKRDFGKDPLLDQGGRRMQWAGRLPPNPAG